MKYLVTGSAGHLGEALVRVLRARGADVTGVDILETEFTGVTGSIADRELVRRCMEGVDVVLHSATLHKPHVVTNSIQDFVDTNITGTLNLLEEAVDAGVRAFVFTSTTSTFGNALRPGAGEGAVWVTEELTPIPKNIYGVSKIAAEDICGLIHKKHGLPCVVLRTSRFFPESDDDAAIRDGFADRNAKTNEFLHRRVDIEDVVSAHLCAVENAARIGFGRYIVSATTPFLPEDLGELRTAPAAVVERRVPGFGEVYGRLGYRMFADIGRVYVNRKARDELGWRPRYDFRRVLDALAAGEDPRSGLAVEIGRKAYHSQTFEDGPYPVE